MRQCISHMYSERVAFSLNSINSPGPFTNMDEKGRFQGCYTSPRKGRMHTDVGPILEVEDYRSLYIISYVVPC